tara:strand:- start:3616 stop:5019 length:1404 start_codon:yes stop_codon:yes gene_type:complete
MKATNVTEAKIKLQVFKGDEPMKNDQGATDLGNLVMTLTVEEGIDLAAISAELVLQDSAGVLDRLSGAEEWYIEIEARDSRNGYYFTAYNIESRSRNNQSEGYIVQLVSREFIINEAKALFGSSEVIFKQGKKAHEIVESILRGNATGGQMTGKNLHVEETQNDLNFVCTTWRPFDTIYFCCNRSIRKSSAGSKSQNGFIFWENIMGYHMKSIDQIISDINAQSEDEKTDIPGGKARLYTYSYSPKKTNSSTDTKSVDGFKVESITFPEDRNYLMAMRNGSYSGFSTALDPSVFGNSKLSVENKNSEQPGSYDLEDFWGDMEHLDNGKCPIEEMPDRAKELVKSKRRVRYAVLPNRLFDPKSAPAGGSAGASPDTKNLDELVFLESYRHLRAMSFKAVKLLVTVPGNMDLYSGYGVKIDIPETKAKGGKINKNERYSGRYCIAALKHSYTDGNLFTEMLLYKDSLSK